MCWADKNEMKVLVIWKALVSEAYHKRFKKLSRFKDVELTLIMPTKWHNTILEKKYCEEGNRVRSLMLTFLGSHDIYLTWQDH